MIKLTHKGGGQTVDKNDQGYIDTRLVNRCLVFVVIDKSKRH
jgi:hypothetical protein